MSVPGPVALGRGIVISSGQTAPPPWSAATRHRLDAAALTEPAAIVTALHRAWIDRDPVVVELAIDAGLLREPESWRSPPWELGPAFEAWSDRLHFLLWANNYDARTDPAQPIWWWGRRTARRPGVEEVQSGEAGDVRLANGAAAWIDGGPRAPFSPLTVGEIDLIHRESVELGRLTVVPRPMQPAAELAPDQLAAVGHRSGPARIIAPAGSGKTRVLTERLRHLLVDRGYESETVLAVAYNKKAQLELEARSLDVRPRVRTLNSLGYKLLAEALGGPPRLLSEREVRRLVEQLVPVRRHRANTDPIAPYIEALGQVRLGLRDPEEVEEWRDDVPGLADAFEPYRAALSETGAIDFDEQIYGAIEALLSDGAFRRRAQAGCRHLLVDEFQDLTPAHVLLLRLLATPQLDVFGVGDDDQVIYGHAGADPAFLIGFERLFPGAGDHPLEVNYRCPATVVEQAAALLSNNERRVPKIIRPGPQASRAADAVRVLTHRASGGAEQLVGVVRRWIDGASGRAVDPSDIAVLARVNALLLAPQVALTEAGIPVDSVLRAEILDRTGLRAALAYLRIAAAPEGRIAAADVSEILRRPSRGLPQWFGDRLRRRTWWSLGQLAAVAEQVPDKDSAKVTRLVGDLTTVVAIAGRPGSTTRSVLAVVKDAVGLGGAMGLLDSSSGGEGSSHLDDLDALEQVAGLHEDVATFETWLRDALASTSTSSGGGAVTLSTVHRVKGMEWEKVAIFGVNAGILPHRLADDIEEERRVLHVALTRCRDQVVLLADQSRMSPMLAELDGTAERPSRPLAGVAVAAAVGLGAVAAVGVGGGATAGRRGATGVGARVGAGAAFGAGGRVARQKRPFADRGGQLPAADPVAEKALRTWRSERSRRDSSPAFIVMHDRTLVAIATARPKSLVALRQIDGIGPTKLELYGDEILAVLEGLEIER